MYMSLDIRQKKIQERRKNTSFRDFLLEVASWYTINLHRNNALLSRYPATTRTPIIVSEIDYNRSGNQMTTLPYDFSIWFFEQFRDLWLVHNHPHVLTFKQNENADFADVVFGAKNAYLSFTLWNNSENIAYSTVVYTHCTNVYNSVKVTNNSQNIYYCKAVTQSFNIYYSRYINNSTDIWFSSNLTGCKHCMMCDSLVNQEYCIENIVYDKKIYEQKKMEILSQKHLFAQYFSEVTTIATNYNADNCHGEWVSFSSNIENGYYVTRATHGRNMMFVEGIDHANNYYDVFEGWVNSDDFYAVSNAGTGANHLYCSRQIESSSYIFYCYYMENCSYCLGCIGLKNASYCILNKQYTKDEWHSFVDQIFTTMDGNWLLWLVGPGWINPFYFNDTAAYLIDPSFSKEEVTALGYLRRDEPVKVDIPDGVDVLQVSELGEYEGFVHPDTSGSVPITWIASSLDSWQWQSEVKRMIDPLILNKIIVDEEGNYYKIVKMEYDFLLKHWLPLPRTHRLDRMKENFRIQI